jgi:hypothetical protein
MNNYIQNNYLHDSYKIIDKIMSYNKKTFSGYKKTSVFTELNNCLIDSRIENSCYWASEIHCSGFIDQLWEKIIIFSSKYVNINNPLLPKYIFGKYQEYKNMVSKCQTKNFIELRNFSDSRKQLCEIIIVLCTSKKINIPKIPKIYESDFDVINIQNKLQAKDTHSIDRIFKNNDPIELRIPINELIFHIKNKNLNNSIYWLTWIIEYDKKISKKEKNLICNSRNIDKIDDKYKTDISWLIWNAIFCCCQNSNYIDQIKYLYQIYKINFTKSKKRSRVSIFIHSILFLIEHVDNSIPLKSREDIIITGINNIDSIYQRIQTCKVEESQNMNQNTENKNKEENLTQKVLKENKVKIQKKKKNDISDESQQKLDIIMNITNNICN